MREDGQEVIFVGVCVTRTLHRPVKLFVGGLAWETTEESLQRVFEKYEKIVEVSIMRHPRTFYSRGFGFVTLSSRSGAEEACNHKHTIDGRVVEAKISAAPGQNNPSGASQVNNSKRRKVFVGGLSADTTDEDFCKYFEQFGEISESQILQDHLTGRSRGFGFITFTDEATSEKVFTKGRFHELKGKLVEVKSATPRQQNKGGRAPRHHGGPGHGKLPSAGPNARVLSWNSRLPQLPGLLSPGPPHGCSSSRWPSVANRSTRERPACRCCRSSVEWVLLSRGRRPLPVQWPATRWCARICIHRATATPCFRVRVPAKLCSW